METLGALTQELNNLLQTSKPDDAERNKKEMTGFRNLFTSFLRAKTHVDWNKIEPLPAGAVRMYKTLEAPTDDRVGYKISIYSHKSIQNSL